MFSNTTFLMHKISLTLSKLLVFILYLFINALFVYKYGIRQQVIHPFLAISAYIILVCLIIAVSHRSKLSERQLSIAFITISITYAVFGVVINLLVEGHQLNVDRWSAMDVGIQALLNNEYPYAALDHLGGRTSNLPTLFLVGLPFYMIGDVGYLQVAAFILFCLLLYKSLASNRAKLIGLLLLISSSAFNWEVFCKSDLISNFIIVLAYVALVQAKFDQNKGFKPFTLGITSALLLLTRLVTVIPLILLLGRKFINISGAQKAKFILASTLTASILILIVFKNYGNWEIVSEKNPFELQNRQLPLVASISIVVLPLIYSLWIQNLRMLLLSSLIFLSLPVFGAFFYKVAMHGLSEAILTHAFDISYFNILTPFVIYFLAFSADQAYTRIPEINRIVQ